VDDSRGDEKAFRINAEVVVEEGVAKPPRIPR
jgi:hypothetical protein